MSAVDQTDSPKGELILYQTEDGQTEINLTAIDGTVWLTQGELAELFATTPQNVTLHIKSIYDDAELSEEATCKDFLQVRKEGARNVERRLKHYNLDMILAVGYRVRSPRGAQFRRWANTVLKEYLIKGFAMDDARLKQAERWIILTNGWRAFVTSALPKSAFIKKSKTSTPQQLIMMATPRKRNFLQKSTKQNALCRVGKNGSRMIAGRADVDKPNMGVTSWKGSVVRKGDVGIAKNYLTQKRLTSLIVSSPCI